MGMIRLLRDDVMGASSVMGIERTKSHAQAIASLVGKLVKRRP